MKTVQADFMLCVYFILFNFVSNHLSISFLKISIQKMIEVKIVLIIFPFIILCSFSIILAIFTSIILSSRLHSSYRYHSSLLSIVLSIVIMILPVVNSNH